MLVNILIYLCAAVISVPIAKRLGLGSVLGYLLAGILIGPFILGLVGSQTDVMHVAEFGVVMMLFLIGLELRPSLLWEMRRSILGLGGSQVLLTSVAITALIHAFSDLSWQVSLAIGLSLALSSTAIVLQSLTERGLLKTQAGVSSFSVLLFQDIAVIPILALLPLLAVSGTGVTEVEPSLSLIEHYPVWLQVIVTSSIIAAIVLAGKFVAAPVFRFIADTHLREVFTAFALLIVVAITVLMLAIGVSPALGAFLAGVVLADNEFRHELEVDIQPFKGLLLGLFFITVGASIDFALLADHPLMVMAAVFSLMLLKALVLGLLAFLFKMGRQAGLLLAVALSQGGEFAFVLATTARQFNVFDLHVSNMLTLIVAISMLISPMLLVLYEMYFSRIQQEPSMQDDREIIKPCQVIVAGYGRFGQIIGRLLQAQGYELTILDHSPSQVEMVRRFGNTVYYGDASRRELLEAAGAADAKLLVIAIDEADKTLDIINIAKKHYPNLKILARSIDRRHTYELIRMKIDGIRRETFESALFLGVDALKLLGKEPEDAVRAGNVFREHDEQTLQMLADLWGDDHSYGVAVRQRMEDLQLVLQSDQESK